MVRDQKDDQEILTKKLGIKIGIESLRRKRKSVINITHN